MTGLPRMRAALAALILAGTPLAGTPLAGTPLAGTPSMAADPITDGQWYVQALRLADAHKITKGKGVTVAVIDTGVDAAHPDLAGSIIPGANFTVGGTSDGLTDTDGHGTGMASLIVGRGRIQGVAPESTVMSVRASSGGGGSSTTTGTAINWAVEHGATVLSLSAGYTDSTDLVLREAIEAALRKNIVIVAASGNTSKVDRIGYPAAFPGVVAVGGTGIDGNYTPAAVTGPEVLLAAPCDKVSTAHLNQQRVVGTGTSNSTALVAGAVALLRAKFPDMPAREIVHRLTTTAVDKGTLGRDSQTGYGLIDIVAALTADVPPLAPESAGPATSPATFTTSAPLPGPGAAFPVGLAVAGGGGCLLLVGAAVILLLVRRRRNEVTG